jgi:hypothetical protein
VAARSCPQCMKPVPAGCAVAFSNGLDCPHCKARLELASASRGVSSLAGLLAGWLVWRATQGMGGVLGPVVPEFYSILAFGVVSAAIVMATASLIPAPPVAEPAPVAASHGHGDAHH